MRALVAVRQGMVLGEADNQHSCLVHELGIELRVAEPSCWGVHTESARSSLATFTTVSTSRAVTSAAIDRYSDRST